MNITEVHRLIRPRRAPVGMSAILLCHLDPHTVDWASTEAHIGRTHAAGLTPAVNMDTGYVQLLDESTRLRVLELAADVTGGDFVAGAFVADGPGAEADLDAHLARVAEIASRGGTPVIFPSHGTCDAGDEQWLSAHQRIAAEVDRFIAFELGEMFVPYGRILGLDAYRELLGISSCVGAKHSSLRREPEWERLALRDELRPDFSVFTGNDLAIDMITYGSDYLLGLSTFAPEAFAERDRRWAAGDAGFGELNDLLQYLGHFTFRAPVPAYRHSAAMFLELRGWAASDAVPSGAPRRPESDRLVLADILARLVAQR